MGAVLLLFHSGIFMSDSLLAKLSEWGESTWAAVLFVNFYGRVRKLLGVAFGVEQCALN